MKTTSIALFTFFTFALAKPTSPPYPSPPPATCPTCDYRPGFNKCDITTSCTMVWADPGPNKPYYCACRAGYQASGVDPKDTTKQWRLPWKGTPQGDPSQEGRVFVAPGVVCDTLCEDWQQGKDGCKKVQELSSCL